MNVVIPPKPVAVKVIGTIFVVIAAIELISLMSGVFMLNYFTKHFDQINYQGRFNPYTLISHILNTYGNKYFIFSSIFNFARYSIMLFSAIQFLRLRSWARTVLEILSWLYIVQSFVWSAVVILVLNGRILSLPSEIEFITENPLKALIIVSYIVFTGVFVTFAVIIIKSLKSHGVRSAMLPS